MASVRYGTVTTRSEYTHLTQRAEIHAPLQKVKSHRFSSQKAVHYLSTLREYTRALLCEATSTLRAQFETKNARRGRRKSAARAPSTRWRIGDSTARQRQR